MFSVLFRCLKVTPTALAIQVVLLGYAINSAAEATGESLQDNLNTIQKYYQTVQNKPGNAASVGKISDITLPEKLINTLNQSNGIGRNQTQLRNETNDRSQSNGFTSTQAQQISPIHNNNQTRAAAYTIAGRDPFAVTPIMLDNENYTLKQQVDFIPLESSLKIPNMRLKGVVTGNREHKLAALLEIDGMGVFVVHEGDTVGLHGIGNGRDVIQIESISRLSLVVLTGSYTGTSQKRFVVR